MASKYARSFPNERRITVVHGAAMGETLEALQRLQDVELQLATIRLKRGAKSRRYENHSS